MIVIITIQACGWDILIKTGTWEGIGLAKDGFWIFQYEGLTDCMQANVNEKKITNPSSVLSCSHSTLSTTST